MTKIGKILEVWNRVAEIVWGFKRDTKERELNRLKVRLSLFIVC